MTPEFLKILQQLEEIDLLIEANIRILKACKANLHEEHDHLITANLLDTASSIINSNEPKPIL